MIRTFDRHTHMNLETLSAIHGIIAQTWEIDSVNATDENALYGLFDGYLYADTLVDLVMKLETVNPMLSVELSDVIATVMQYPFECDSIVVNQ